MNLREAAQQALEAMELEEAFDPPLRETAAAMKALRAALAEPVQLLTDEEIIGMTCDCIDKGTFNMDCAIDFAHAIEAAIKDRT